MLLTLRILFLLCSFGFHEQLLLPFEWHINLWNKEEQRNVLLSVISILIPQFLWISLCAWVLIRFERWIHVAVKLTRRMTFFAVPRLMFSLRYVLGRDFSLSPKNDLQLCLCLLLTSLERRSRFMSCDIRAWLCFFSLSCRLLQRHPLASNCLSRFL